MDPLLLPIGSKARLQAGNFWYHSLCKLFAEAENTPFGKPQLPIHDGIQENSDPAIGHDTFTIQRHRYPLDLLPISDIAVMFPGILVFSLFIRMETHFRNNRRYFYIQNILSKVLPALEISNFQKRMAVLSAFDFSSASALVSVVPLCPFWPPDLFFVFSGHYRYLRLSRLLNRLMEGQRYWNCHG